MNETEKYESDQASGSTANDKRTGKKPSNGKGKLTPLGRTLTFIGSFIMWAAVLLCLVLAAPRAVGLKSYVVVSGSMEPAIPVGSMVYVKKVDPPELSPGEVIVFYNNKNGNSGDMVTITHRVVENHKENAELITKGDANADNDFSPVSYGDVIGRVVYCIRRLGYLAAPLSSTVGKIAAVMIILAGYLITEAGSRFRIY